VNSNNGYLDVILRGILGSIPYIVIGGITAWAAWRTRVKPHLERIAHGQTADLTKAAHQITDQQTADLKEITDQQTAELRRSPPRDTGGRFTPR